MVTIILIIAIIFIVWLAYELVTAPMMPDDYDVRYYKDIEYKIKKSKKNGSRN